MNILLHFLGYVIDEVIYLKVTAHFVNELNYKAHQKKHVVSQLRAYCKMTREYWHVHMIIPF